MKKIVKNLSKNFAFSSPLSAGLFHRAIAMSGNASSPWVMNSRLTYCIENFKKITKTNSAEELKNKLENISFDELREYEANSWFTIPNFYFVLTVGDSVLPLNPYRRRFLAGSKLLYKIWPPK